MRSLSHAFTQATHGVNRLRHGCGVSLSFCLHRCVSPLVSTSADYRDGVHTEGEKRASLYFDAAADKICQLLGAAVPTISAFYGILIQMFFDDHAPPHFHVKYGEFKAVIDI